MHTGFLPENLIEALPYIVGFKDKVVVIKMGGSFLDHPSGKEAVIKDISLLHLVGMKVIVVHGGGKEINARLDAVGLETRFEKGYRVTCEKTMEEVEMTLTGRIAKEIVLKFNNNGVKSVGINGKDGLLMKAEKKWIHQETGAIDLGHVGDVVKINPEILEILLNHGYIPVVSPIGYDEEGITYNINADSAAAAISCAMEAEKLVLMTDVDGVYEDYENRSGFKSQLTLEQCEAILEQKDALKGMGPKLECAVEALKSGVHSVHLLNGSTPHSLLMEIFSKDGIGTQIQTIF